MRKRALYPLLAGLLALCLTSCGPAAEASAPDTDSPVPAASIPASAEPVTQPEEPSLPPDTPEPVPELVLEGSLPDREYAPWQRAYMDFLTRLCRIEMGLPWDYGTDDVDGIYEGLAVDERGVAAWEESLAGTMAMGSDAYSLYDVDRDGVPELFVSYGWEGLVTQCYAFRDGQLVCVGEFSTKDSSLYGHPEKDAVLCHGGRMGFYYLNEYLMEDGILTEERELFSEGNEKPVDSPTDAEQLVPGAKTIKRFYTGLGEWDGNRFRAPESEGLDDGRPHPSAGKALLLPIADYYDGPAVTGSDSEQARTAILAALNGEQPFYGVSGDHFYGDVGWITWEEYIQPEAAYPYNKTPFQIMAHVWLDLNGDGQEECVLRLEAVRNEESWPDHGTVVLSEQDGTVYAYFLGFYGSADLGADGVFCRVYGEDDRYDCALSFWQDQCYEYAVQPGTAVDSVKWLDGSPAG